MAIRQKVYADFTGGLNNVNSKDTINSGTTRTESPDMVNVEYLGLGGIKSMEGNFRVGDIQTSSIVGGWEYRKGNDKYMIIATYNGEVKVFNPATDEFDLIYTFDHPSFRVSFCNMNNGVVVTNGIDDLIFYEKGRKQILSGTVNTTEGSDVVTGVGTKFQTELHPGDSIQIGNGVYYVGSITSDTELILRDNAIATEDTANIYLSEVSECNAVLVNEEDPNVATPIRGRAIQYYKGRLWIGGDNGLFYSQVGLYNGWDVNYDAGVLYSVYNDSSEIKALGLFSDFLMIHKEFSSYILTIESTGDTIQLQPYTNISCDSQQSWVVSNTKYYLYSAENMGIYPIGQRTVFSDRFVGEEISTKVRSMFRRIRTADTDTIFAVTLPNKRWMMFYLPLNDGIGSNNVLIFDFQTKSWLFRRIPQEVTIAFNYNNYVYVGTADGKVLREFSGSTFDGEMINAYYRMPWLSWYQGYTQSFSEFVIELDNEYNNNFYIRTYRDGLLNHEDRIIDSENLLGEGLIWDGYSQEYTYNYYFKSFPVNYYSYTGYTIPLYYTNNDVQNGDILYKIEEDEAIPFCKVYYTYEDMDNETVIHKNIKIDGIEYEINLDNDNFVTLYNNITTIPIINDNANSDIIYTIDENVYFSFYREDSNLVVNKYNNNVLDSVAYMTIDNYYLDNASLDNDNFTYWDEDEWVASGFQHVRMLLPNNVFKDFQVEIGTNAVGQGFAFYSMSFRRIEPDEAPW